MSWRDTQEAHARECRRQFYKNAGHEVPLFEEGMALILEALAVAPSTEQEQVCKMMLAVAYQLIDASWQDLICGRMASSMTHRRSVWDAYDYLAAAAVDGDFARGWLASGNGRRTVKVEAARKRLRDAFEKEKRGSGKGLQESRAQQGKSYQALPHFVPSLLVGVVNAAKLKDGPDAATSPMGYYLESMVRTEAAILALLMLRILWAAFAGLKGQMAEDLIERIVNHVAGAFAALERVVEEKTNEHSELNDDYWKAVRQEAELLKKTEDIS